MTSAMTASNSPLPATSGAMADNLARHSAAARALSFNSIAARLAQDQVGGGKVPVMGVRLDESGVEAAVGDHGEAIGKRRDVGLALQTRRASARGSASIIGFGPADARPRSGRRAP